MVKKNNLKTIERMDPKLSRQEEKNVSSQESLPVRREKRQNIGKYKLSFETAITALLILLLLWLSFSLSKSLINTMMRQNRIVEERQARDVLAKEVERLKDEVEYYRSDSFLEGEGRDKVGLLLPGEEIVVLPQERMEEIENLVRENEVKVVSKKIPAWEKWYFFFFEH